LNVTPLALEGALGFFCGFDVFPAFGSGCNFVFFAAFGGASE
jgi:hypothetical protein